MTQEEKEQLEMQKSLKSQPPMQHDGMTPQAIIPESHSRFYNEALEFKALNNSFGSRGNFIMNDLNFRMCFNLR